ncbi:LCP family protein required for cell wall assembly [Bacillus pakistanensis]|uniref:Regulatory protein MsrR n=1 Tax=Rossellomorea pakistanensis TaxID=992288 RepID=A0ABS2N8R0_9BACI|nr:LCP family protein [Bacillus pakistanensis]MBM7584218.1 LCP family protein required for cell wall assembly [Bacillus pakistanensis]
MKRIRLLIQMAAAIWILQSCSPLWGDSSSQEKIPEKDSKESFETDKDLKSPFPLSLAPEQEPIKVLIIGSDHRQNDAARSDTLMVAQYHPPQQSLKILSIMRDTYVYIPGYGKSKINHSYSWGGEELLKTTIKENFNITIDHVVNIDFEGFVELVDSMIPGGIEVSLTEKMINYWDWDKQPGQQRLHGEDLLQYVRFRGDETNDFGRVDRQQEVMKKIQEEVLGNIKSGDGLKTVINLIKKGTNVVETDMQIHELIPYGASTIVNPIQSVETLRIPVRNSYKDVLTNNAGLVLQIDKNQNVDAIKQFFY